MIQYNPAQLAAISTALTAKVMHGEIGINETR